ncbi:MAG: DUF58 domain-containing protein [Chloroflexi bacterium]|nr:DUF58 domain-containing protein [Chloroflexota bacterium]MCY4248505.1 DUF58 domain-containing protein [Chloroflexota bacterium]
MPSERRRALYLLAAVCLFIALFTGRAILFSIVWLVGVLLLLSRLWTWQSLSGIALRRRTRSRRSQVGRVFRESFSLRRTNWLPKLWMEIHDHSTLPGHRASHVVPNMLGKREYSWTAETVCSARGEFLLGPVTVISSDPFGLFQSPRRLGATERLIVYPRVVDIRRVLLPVSKLSGGDAQRQLTHHVTTNASSIRDYVPGDSMNRIHWRSTARTGELMVKEFELDPLVDIWLFSDFSEKSAYDDGSIRRASPGGTIIPTSSQVPPATEEYGVVIAASLAKHFIDDERVVGFSAYTPNRHFVLPDRGNRQLAMIWSTLAVARCASEMNLREMLSLEAMQFTRGTTLMIITSSLDASWIAEAQVLQRRGIRPFCVFIDPATFNPRLDSSEVRGMLQLAKIPVLIVCKGDDIGLALEQRPI